MAAYQNLLARGQGVADQPLQQYQGNIVAPLTGDQISAIQEIGGAQGAAQPYISAAAQDIGSSMTPLAPIVQPYANQAMATLQEGNQTLANAGATLNNAGQTLDTAGTYFNTAGNYFNQAGTPISAANIEQFENPYTHQVVNSTEAQFANQNAQQLQGVRGNAISQGAFGGDREAVAEGITSGQQQLAEAPVIAGLENTGFQTALQAAEQQKQLELGAGQGWTGAGQGMTGAAQGLTNVAGGLTGAAQALTGEAQGINATGAQLLGAQEANNWLASQAGYGMANLGNEALNTSLTGANALLGAGGLEQQVEQENLNVPYEQFLQQQAYPFQTTQFLGGLTEGLGGMAGGSSSTTSPGPSPISQAAGLGLTTTGILGMTGAFGPAGYLTGAGAAGLGAGALDTGALAATGALSDAAMGGLGLGAGADLGAFLVADGGAVPELAPGGLVPFPMHRTRPPRIGLANDNDPFPHFPRRLAAGGPLVINVPADGGGGGLVSPTPPSGMTVPKISSPVGGGLVSGGGMSAPSGPAQTSAPSGAGILAQQNAPAPFVTPPASDSNPGGFRTGGLVPRRDDGGDLPDDSGGWLGMPILRGTDAPAPPPPASRGDGVGALDDSAGWLGMPILGESGVPPGSHDHTGIAPPDRHEASPAAAPDLGIKITPRNTDTNLLTPDWHADVPPLAPGNAPQLTMPDTGTGSAPPPMATVRPPVHRAMATQPTGLVPPPPSLPPPPAQQAPQKVPWEDEGIPGDQGAVQADRGTGKTAPWETLLAAGLGIMGGTSPFASVNIGRGGLEGLKFGEQQRVREENTALRRLQAEDLATYRQQMGMAAGQRAQTGEERVGVAQQRAGTYQQMADTSAARAAAQNDIAQRSLQLRQQGLDERTANNRAMMEWRQGNQDLSLANSMTRADQGQQRIDQGNTRIDQANQRLQESQQYHQQTLQVRRDALAQAKDLGERRMIQTATDADLRTAGNMHSNDPNLSFAKALAQVRQGRAQATPDEATPAPTAAAPAGSRPPLQDIFGQ